MKATVLLRMVQNADAINPLQGSLPTFSSAWPAGHTTWLSAATAVSASYQATSTGGVAAGPGSNGDSTSELLQRHLWCTNHLPSQWLTGPDEAVSRLSRDEWLVQLRLLEHEQQQFPALLVPLLEPVIRSLAGVRTPEARQCAQSQWLPSVRRITSHTRLLGVCDSTKRAITDWSRQSAERLLSSGVPAEHVAVQQFRHSMLMAMVAVAYRHMELLTFTHVMRATTITSVSEQYEAVNDLLRRWTGGLAEALSSVMIATAPMEEEALIWVAARLDTALWLNGGGRLDGALGTAASTGERREKKRAGLSGTSGAPKEPSVSPPAAIVSQATAPATVPSTPKPSVRGLSASTLRRFETDLTTMLGSTQSPAGELGRMITLFLHGFPVPRVALLTGATGSGKSYALKAIQMAYELAFEAPLATVTVDAGSLRPAGWHGTGVSDIREQMIAATNSRNERGVLILDAFHSNAPGREEFIEPQDDRSHRAKAMRDLIGIFDGQKGMVSRTTVPSTAPTALDASRWFVVAVGVFDSRTGAPSCKTLTDLGYPAELIDRIAHFTHLEPFANEALVPIANNALADLADKYSSHGLTIRHDPDLGAQIARTVTTHALPLRSVLHLLTKLHADVALRMLREGAMVAQLGTHDDVLPTLTQFATRQSTGA